MEIMKTLRLCIATIGSLFWLLSVSATPLVPQYDKTSALANKSLDEAESLYPPEKAEQQRELWQIQFDVDSRAVTQPAIGHNGHIYVASDATGLHSMSTDGSVNWVFDNVGGVVSSAVVSADGTVHFSAFNPTKSVFNVHAVNPDGTEKWRYYSDTSYPDNMAIDHQGRLFFATNDEVIALTPDGDVIWRYATGGRSYSVVVANNGTIYFRGPLYLTALTPDGKEKWQFEYTIASGTPTISTDGTIYTCSQDRYFYAVSPSGSLKWRVPIDCITNATVDADGTIYVGSYDGYLYALNADGTEKWKFETGNHVFTSALIGKNGNLYFTSIDDYVYAITSDGELRWRFKTAGDLILSPAMDEQGRLYLGTDRGLFYALQTDSPGMAETPWPKFRQNNTNTGVSPSVKEFDAHVRFDYDGDGRADPAIRNQLSFNNSVLSSSNSQTIETIFGRDPNDIPISGDFDGDGIADIAMRRPATQFWYIQNSSGRDLITNNADGITRVRFGLQEDDIPVPADYDGDGRTDLAVRRPADFLWFIRNSGGVDLFTKNNDGITRLRFGLDLNDIPVVADYDGDGKADVAVRRPSTRYWYINNSSGEDPLSNHADAVTRIQFGLREDDIPVTGDFDNDSRADLAFRRPGNQFWYVLNSSETNFNSALGDGIQRVRFGLNETDIPVIADYDGDGISDFAVFRSSNQFFYIRQSSDNVIIRQPFGDNPDVIPFAAPVMIRQEMSAERN